MDDTSAIIVSGIPRDSAAVIPQKVRLSYIILSKICLDWASVLNLYSLNTVIWYQLVLVPCSLGLARKCHLFAQP